MLLKLLKGHTIVLTSAQVCHIFFSKPLKIAYNYGQYNIFNKSTLLDFFWHFYFLKFKLSNIMLLNKSTEKYSGACDYVSTLWKSVDIIEDLIKCSLIRINNSQKS